MVDDNKVIRQLIRVNLELEGFEVVTAANGEECLELVHRVRPDVVTLDVVMPKVDGIAAARRLRADPRTRHLPIAIVSGGGRFPDAICVDAFVGKPFEPAELVRVVRRLMATRSLRDTGALLPPCRPAPSWKPPGGQPPRPSVR